MGAKTVLTLEQFERLPDDGMQHELNDGELITMPPPGFLHGRVQSKIFAALVAYLSRSQVGEVVSDAGFVLSRDPDVVRQPDLAFVDRKRYAAGTPVGYLEGAPELAVEVVSPSQPAVDLRIKVRQYLQSGAAEVWVVYPETREVQVFAASGGERTLPETETLETSLLPGFSLPIRTLFDF